MTSLRVICGLGPPNQKSWLRLCYPTTSRSLVKKALTYVLNPFSHYSKAAVKILVDLALFCLNNVVMLYKVGFLTQNIGIVTGDNHPANITLHQACSQDLEKGGGLF